MNIGQIQAPCWASKKSKEIAETFNQQAAATNEKLADSNATIEMLRTQAVAGEAAGDIAGQLSQAKAARLQALTSAKRLLAEKSTLRQLLADDHAAERRKRQSALDKREQEIRDGLAKLRVQSRFLPSVIQESLAGERDALRAMLDAPAIWTGADDAAMQQITDEIAQAMK